MAFPSVVSVTETISSGVVTSLNISMPASVAAGDLLLIIMSSTGDSIGGGSTPSGFTLIDPTSADYDGDNCYWAVFAKSAAGTEGATNVTYTPGDDAAICAQVYRITGWKASGTLTNDIKVIRSFNATGTTDPPSLTTGWGAEDVLWLACCFEDVDAIIASTVPTNYANGVKTNTGSRSQIMSCRRNLNAASEDPAAFAVSAGTGRVYVATMAIRPSSVAATDRIGRVKWAEVETPSVGSGGAFPTLLDITETRDLGAASASFVINYPATVNVADCLIIFMGLGNPGGTSGYTLPSGWTPICESGENGNTYFYCLARAALGTEDGGTLTITLNSVAGAKVAQVYRISNWYNGGAISADVQGLAQFQSTTTPDPLALTPSWGSASTLWIEGVCGDVSEYTTGSLSANYSNASKTVGTGRNHMLTGSRANLVATEDPGAFATLSSSGRLHVMTIGVRPAVTGNRRSKVSWAEMETQAGPTRRARMTYAEFQVPDVSKKGQVGFAEFETPDQPTNRKGQVRWAEFETPLINRRGNVAWAQWEVPNVIITPPEIFPFTILIEQDVAMEISLFNDPLTLWTPTVSTNIHTYSLGTRNIIDGYRREIFGVSVNGKEYATAKSLAEVDVIGQSFVYLAATNQIAINPTNPAPGGGTTLPQTAIVLARFKMYWSNYSVDSDGHAFEPRLLLGPDDASIRVSIEDQFMASTSVEAGSYSIANGGLTTDNYTMDQLLRDYIFLGQQCKKLQYVNGEHFDLASSYVGEIIRKDSFTQFNLWT